MGRLQKLEDDGKRTKYVGSFLGALAARTARISMRSLGGSMPIQKLIQFLDEHLIQYIVIAHSKAYTAQGVAAISHISGNELAKTVMLNKDGELCMAVLPASKHVDFALFAKQTKSRDVSLASENDFRSSFPDCELGAMPPFGNLYGLPVYVDESLTHDKEIAFNAGSHLELVKLAYSDFERLVNPTVVNFISQPISRAA